LYENESLVTGDVIAVGLVKKALEGARPKWRHAVYLSSPELRAYSSNEQISFEMGLRLRT